MVLDSLKGVAVPMSVRLMWQSTISMGKNFLEWIRQARVQSELLTQFFESGLGCIHHICINSLVPSVKKINIGNPGIQVNYWGG